MARFSVFLLLAVAALAQASLPTNTDQDAAQAVLRKLPLFGQKAKPLCKECEKIVTALKKIVENPDTEQKLLSTLTSVCNLPILSRFKDTCLNLVGDVVVLIHELQSFLDDPSKVCDTIKLCDSEAPSAHTVTKRLLLSVASKIVQDVRKPSPLMAVDTCNLCTTALDELKRLLEIPQITEKLENETKKLCKHLGPFEQACNSLIDNYIQEFFDIVEDILCNPQQSCTTLHLCKASLLTNVHQLNRKAAPVSHPHLDRFLAKIGAIQTTYGFSIGCAACKTSVGAALKILKEDSVLTSLTKDITDFVCKILPSSQKDGCFDFLGIYGKTALQLTVNEWTPAEICTSMHACSSVTVHQLESLPTIEKSKVACDACKAVTKTLAFELQQPELQQDIINVLTQGCLLLPGKFANKCGDLVIQYVPFAIGYVADFCSRDDVCSVLHVC